MSNDELSNNPVEGQSKQPSTAPQSQSNPAMPQQMVGGNTVTQAMPSQPTSPVVPGHSLPQQGVPNSTFVGGQGQPVQQASQNVSQETMAGSAGFAPNTMVTKKPYNGKRIAWIISGIVLAVIVVIAGLFLFRVLSGNIEGTYKSRELSKDLSSSLRDTGFDHNSDVKYSDFTKKDQVDFVVEDDKLTAKVTYSVVYDDFYKKIKENYSSQNILYEDTFTDDEWDYLMNTLIMNDDYDEKGFEKTLSDEVEETGLSYDSDTGQVTGILFEGKVDRVQRKIEITKVNQDSELGDFKKGQKLSYDKDSDGLTFTDEEGDESRANNE